MCAYKNICLLLVQITLHMRLDLCIFNLELHVRQYYLFNYMNSLNKIPYLWVHLVQLDLHFSLTIVELEAYAEPSL